MQWFRMYAEAVDDEKLRLLAFEDRWHFVALLCLKSGGILDELNAELKTRKICVKLGLDSVELETVMKRLETVGLVSVTGQPLNWNKRQFLSDSSTSRVRAFRKRFSNKRVTPSEADTESDTDTEKRREEAEPARKQRSRKVPSDFELTAELRASAQTEVPDLDVDAEFAKFRDHEFRDPHSDWEGTWRNWVRRGKEQGRYVRKPKAGTLMHEGKPVVWDR